jgi:hypothetical protein
MYIHQSKTWYDTYDTKRKSPNNQLERAKNPKFPPQAHKCSLVERLCENVCKLILGRDMAQHNGPFLHIVSQEMVPHFYMFGSGLKHRVFRYAYGTGAITKKWDLGALLTKVSQCV